MLGWIRLVLIAVLAACASDDATIRTRMIELDVATGANGDNPVALDVVLAYDPALVEQLVGLSAADWFRRRGEIGLAFPTGVEVSSFEVVPGQPGLVHEISQRGEDAIAAFVFADYASRGPHRARVDALERFALRLGPKDFSIEAAVSSGGST